MVENVSLITGSGAFADEPFVALWRRRGKLGNSQPGSLEIHSGLLKCTNLFESITLEYLTMSYFCLAFDVFKVIILLKDKTSPWFICLVNRIWIYSFASATCPSTLGWHSSFSLQPHNSRGCTEHHYKHNSSLTSYRIMCGCPQSPSVWGLQIYTRWKWFGIHLLTAFTWVVLLSSWGRLQQKPRKTSVWTFQTTSFCRSHLREAH